MKKKVKKWSRRKTSQRIITIFDIIYALYHIVVCLIYHMIVYFTRVEIHYD